MSVANQYTEELREHLPIRYDGLSFYPLPVMYIAR